MRERIMGVFAPSRGFKKATSFIISIVIPAFAVAISFVRDIPISVIIGGLAALIMLQISLLYDDFADDLDILVNSAENQAVIEPVRESSFYDRWKYDVKQADKRVEICYFDNRPPLQSTDEEKVAYYNEIEELTKKKSEQDVEFRRIIRANPALHEWVERMVEELEGVSKFSLACLPDENPAERLKPHVAVQLIDDEKAYFVAVGEQQERANPRDLYIESEALNSQWSRYYDRIWDDCFVILDRGSINEGEYQDYQDHIGDLSDGE